MKNRVRLLSLRRVHALVSLRLRRLWRTRAVILAAALALLPLLAMSPASARTAFVATTSALLTAVLVCGAGALADDLDSGAALLLLLHEARPVERVLAESSATMAVVAALGVVAAPLVAGGLADAGWRLILVGGFWTVALLTAWTSLLVLLGCALPGKGNALVLIVPLAAFALPAAALPLEAVPVSLAGAIRTAWNLLPLQAHATAIVDALVADAPLPATARWVLLASPPVYLAAAVRALSRVEPARRFTQ